MTRLKSFWRLIKATIAHSNGLNTSMIAGALAYYTLFSLAPTLIVMIAVAGLIYGPQAVRGQLFAEIQSWVGPDVATTIQTMLASISRPDSNIVLTILGLATSLYGASYLFYQLQYALNLIWKVPTTRTEIDVIALLQRRFVSFVMVLSLGFLLFLSLMASTVVAAINRILGLFLPEFVTFVPILQITDLMVTFVLSTLLFAFIYKALPDREVAWPDVWPGALLVSSVFSMTKMIFGLYVGYTTVITAYGVVGSLLLILVWLFYAVHVFIFGAAFTYVYAHKYGSRAHDSRREHRVLVSRADEESLPVSPFSFTLKPHTEVLPPVFRDLWLLPAGASYRVVLEGVLDKIWQRPSWLRPFFFLLQRAGGLLMIPGENVPVVITITAGRDSDDQPFHLWQRSFHQPQPRQLNTRIVYDTKLESVVERFGPKQMLQLVWVVRFRSPLILEMEVSDCVLHFRQLRSSLPRWMWLVTRFQAKVEAPHAGRLHIKLVRNHSLLGEVFGYEGNVQQRLEPVSEKPDF